MQAFSSILGSLGGLTGVEKGLGAITSLGGLINQFSLAQKEKQAMDRSLYYSKHPEAINALVKGFERPLSAGLTSGVGNIVNASLAEQGLSQAPGIQSQVLSQALAPYQQNEQQMAIAEAFKAIGLPTDALSAIQSTMRPDQLAMLLKGILPGSGGGGTPNPGNLLRDIALSGGGPQTTPSILADNSIPYPGSIVSDTGLTPPDTGGGGGLFNA